MDNAAGLPSLRALVRQYIVEGISAGTLAPGDRISEQRIADALAVSRTPTREAMLQLNSEGLLDYAPRRGFSIRRPSEKEKEDTYELMALLDAYCARKAVPLMDEGDLNAMRELTDKLDIAIKYRNLDDYRVLQSAFHQVYRRKCGNDRFEELLAQSENGAAPGVFISEDTDALMELYSMLNGEHRRIIELFAAGDAQGLFDYLLNTHWALRFLDMTEFKSKEKKHSRKES